ncbi:hypothetical protein [Pareuzebyella sediminis]|uniref:hypothetical protein n=1 Tax=Pareuzebyella sediminis TaxID=2607998 RepID=UPI0011F006A2|nr:hypothetical protein [Pareuzebyella sediminis]
MHIKDCNSTEEIISIVDKIEKNKMNPGSHGYENLIDSSINDTAKNYTKKAKKRPAILLMEVVLAANRNFNRMVKSRVELIEKSKINSIEQLHLFMGTTTMEDFFYYWNTKDRKKHNTLKPLIHAFKEITSEHSANRTEFDCLSHWANNVDLKNLESDPVGKIDNIGIAPLQDLHMDFWANKARPKG